MTTRLALLAAALCAAATPSALAAQPAMARAERALNGPPAPYVDPGPADAKVVSNTVVIVFAPVDLVRRVCPAGPDWHSLACTLMPSRTVVMPDEETTELTREQWLKLLRHEILHAQGEEFDRGDR